MTPNRMTHMEYWDRFLRWAGEHAPDMAAPGRSKGEPFIMYRCLDDDSDFWFALRRNDVRREVPDGLALVFTVRKPLRATDFARRVMQPEVFKVEHGLDLFSYDDGSNRFQLNLVEAGLADEPLEEQFQWFEKQYRVFQRVFRPWTAYLRDL